MERCNNAIMQRQNWVFEFKKAREKLENRYGTR